MAPEQELIGVQAVEPDEVKHGINVDAEALAIRNLADEAFQDGRDFAPVMVLFRGENRIATATSRPWKDDADKDIAMTEMGALIPTFKANEIVFGFGTIMVKGDQQQKGLAAISVMCANKVGATMRVFPYFTTDEGGFRNWTEEGTDKPVYDPFVSSMIGGYMAYKKRPFMMAALVTTLNRRGHSIEVHSDDIEGLVSKLNV